MLHLTLKSILQINRKKLLNAPINFITKDKDIKNGDRTRQKRYQRESYFNKFDKNHEKVENT